MINNEKCVGMFEFNVLLKTAVIQINHIIVSQSARMEENV